MAEQVMAPGPVMHVTEPALASKCAQALALLSALFPKARDQLLTQGNNLRILSTTLAQPASSNPLMLQMKEQLMDALSYAVEKSPRAVNTVKTDQAGTGDSQDLTSVLRILASEGNGPIRDKASRVLALLR